MTGELAPARHVLSAATGNWEPGSNRPRDAMLVATSAPGPIRSWRHSHPALSLPTKPNQSVWKTGYAEGHTRQSKPRFTQGRWIRAGINEGRKVNSAVALFLNTSR